MKKTRLIILALFTTWFCASCTKPEDDHYQPLDYAVQTIPTIDRIIPKKLIAAMGSNLHFGDTPPNIDTCFFAPRFHLDATVKNDPGTSYNYAPQWFTYRFTWQLGGQHRCVADSILFERRYLENYVYESSVSDTVFIMGSGDFFTLYYEQEIEYLEAIPTNYPNNLIRKESVIVSGKVIADSTDHDRITGITNLKMGTFTESYYNKNNHKVYTHNNDTIGVTVPAIQDILLYSSQDDTLQFDPAFKPFSL